MNDACCLHRPRRGFPIKKTIAVIPIVGALLAGCATPTASPTATPTQGAVVPRSVTNLRIRTGRLAFSLCGRISKGALKHAPFFFLSASDIIPMNHVSIDCRRI